MELAEIGRYRASMSTPQTHQGGLLSSICIAVAVCLGMSPLLHNYSKRPSRPHRGEACGVTEDKGIPLPQPVLPSAQLLPRGHPKRLKSYTPLAQSHQCVGMWQSESERASGERASERRHGGEGVFFARIGGRTWLSPRGGPSRRHLSTLSAWGGVR